MQKMIGPSLGLMVALTAVASIAGELQSGLQVGDKVGAFQVKDITGPRKGKSLCYR